VARTGTPLVIKLARKICKTVSKYGASNLEASTSEAFSAAIGALIIACAAFEAADDHPAEIDITGPQGPEDGTPVFP
jgi:hypothetical protein